MSGGQCVLGDSQMQQQKRDSGECFASKRVQDDLVLDEAAPAAHALQMSGGSSVSNSLRCSDGTSALDVDVKMVFVSPSVAEASMKGSSSSLEAAWTASGETNTGEGRREVVRGGGLGGGSHRWVGAAMIKACTC